MECIGQAHILILEDMAAADMMIITLKTDTEEGMMIETMTMGGTETGAFTGMGILTVVMEIIMEETQRIVMGGTTIGTVITEAGATVQMIIIMALEAGALTSIGIGIKISMMMGNIHLGT